MTVQTLTLELAPVASNALSTWSGAAQSLLALHAAAPLTVGAALLSMIWTRSLVRSIAGSVMVIGAVLATVLAATLSPFLVVMCIPPAVYAVLQGSYWATTKGSRLVWFILVMDGRARADLQRGICWLWLGVCVVGLGFHFAYLLNPNRLSWESIQYGATQAGYMAVWVIALMVGYTLAVYSLAAMWRGFGGVLTSTAASFREVQE